MEHTHCANEPEKQKQVHDVLLMPIECTSRSGTNATINKAGNAIKSTQLYKSGPDPDMSDIAIGFYKILYPEIGSILTPEGLLACQEFAGDTMNSFNSIANITKGAGQSKNSRTPQEEWPEYLKKYHASYHCLANFWVLPIHMGRRTAKLNRRDSMDIFLSLLQGDGYETHFKPYPQYLSWADSYSEFVEKHFLGTYSNIELIPYHEGHAEELVDQAMGRITQRAEDLAKSSYCNSLYDFFYECGLIDRLG